MLKQVVFLRKRDDLSMEAFLDYYETQHSQLSRKMGAKPALPNAQRYVRRYVTPVPNPLTGETIHPGYDCIMEIWWNSREDFEAAMRGLADPAMLEHRKADELRLFASNSNPVCIVEEHDSPVGPDNIIPRFVAADAATLIPSPSSGATMTDLIAADVGIRQLHARFVDATWRLDPVSFAECFAVDGEWKIAGMHLRGRAEIETTFGKLLGIYCRVLLNAGQTIIDIGADGVTGRVPLMEFAQFADGTSAMSIGFYFDRYVEEGGRWRYAHRHWNFEYRGPTDLTGAFRDSPDYGPPPGMPGPDEPTYVRPQ